LIGSAQGLLRCPNDFVQVRYMLNASRVETILLLRIVLALADSSGQT
jgi:hypothetical protein